MSTSATATRRVTRGRAAVWIVLCLIPVVAAFVLQWLPIFNGPHLFLGMPTILWWTCVPGSLLVTLILVIIERTRPDLDRQGHLDELALEAAEAREAADDHGSAADHKTERSAQSGQRTASEGEEF